MFPNFRRLGAGVFLAVLFSSPLLCQTFSGPKNYGSFTYTSQLQTGDFNRDGFADFVGNALIDSGTQSEVVVYMNSGTGTFSTPVALPGTSGAGQVAVGDFNQDGNLDVAFLTASGVGVSYGKGNGSFASPLFYATNGVPDSIAVQDYNGDGKPDIATLSNENDEITILTNTGTYFTSTSFAVPLYYKSQGYSGDAVGGLVAGDFEGTHKQDLAYVDTCTDANCGPQGRIYTLINSGTESFTATLLPDVVSSATQLTAADVDLDGKVDLLVFSEGAGYVAEAYVDYSNGNGSFKQVFIDDFESSYGIPESLVVADFNNDGIEDVAGYTQTDGYGDLDYGFEVFTGKGGRTGFNAPVHFADTASPEGGFATGFIDTNPTKDIALVDSTSFAIYLNTTAYAKDPCAYPTKPGLHNCGPKNGSSGPATIRVLDAYKASVQPAQQIEFWVDGKKVFQEYGDLLSTTVTLSSGEHALSVVGVDATGEYIKSNTTYTVAE